MRLSKKILASTISAALLFGAPSALAQSSGQKGYSKPAGIIQTQIDNGCPTCKPPKPPGDTVQTPQSVTQTSSAGKLPFTGLDLVLVVAAGGLLLGLGLAMRRLTRSSGIA